jgi:rhamnogalacturonyl hydrolase YesR
MQKFIVLILILVNSITGFSQTKENSGEDFHSLTQDGAWCWFSDPRAVSLNDKIYTGWVASDGSIIASSYNVKTGEIQKSNLYSKFNKDDHANPSFLILPDNRIMVFFTAHSGMGLGKKKPAIWYSITENPEDITSWGQLQTQTQNTKGWRAFCYTNPIMLSKEDNRIYLFWRGGDSKPTFCYTDNQGKSWSEVFTLLSSNDNVTNRPYMKVSSNGKDEIYFAFTDGHPRNEPFNSIYYLKYKLGKFYKADGTLIGSMESLPIAHEDCDVVYNAQKEYKKTAFGVRSWIWDVAVDATGHPVLAYTRLPEETTHQYYYARWNGSEWENHKISNAGNWFPRYKRDKSTREPEPHYSGGVHLDHENPNTVYLSKPVKDIFEIFKYETSDYGKTWENTAITSHSKKDNVRPFAIKGAGKDCDSQILWMYNDNYSHFTDFKSRIKIDKVKKELSPVFSKEKVREAMERVAHWQIDEKLAYKLADWTNGALYAGMVEWAKMANDSIYFDWLKDKGEKNHWAQMSRINPKLRYHADDYAVGQMYVEMYRAFGDKKMIKPLENYFNFILKNPSKRSLEFDWNAETCPTERWSWCDALFMGPTVWAKMANVLNRKDYLEFMDKEYRKTYKYLYDKKEHLFYRDSRYFSKKESNGRKVFWGRGNGWVIGGLPCILEELPKDFKGREFYETLFTEMASKIASLQDENGYWHASLLDPESYPNPETSASAFYTYALAWGINNGYLSKEKYLPVVTKGWQALLKAVYPDGRLGWVQPIGADPKNITKEMTEVYGVGAFLLAGKEIYKMSEPQK